MPDNVPEKPQQRDEESLAEAPLIPVWVEGAAKRASLGADLVLIGSIGISFLTFVSSFMGPTHGATQSAKLQWEQRQLEIDQAEHDAQSSCNPQE